MTRPVTILHVDDEDVVARTASTSETVDGDFTVYTATGIDAAFDSLQANNIDCIVTSPVVSDEPQFSFLESVHERYPDIPVVIFADGDAECVLQSYEYGADEYIPYTGNGDGYVVLLNTIRDITAQPRYEETMYDLPEDISEQHLLNQIVRYIPTAIYVKDAEGRHILLSDYEQSPEEALGKTDYEVYGEGLARESYKDDMRVIENEEPLHNREEYNPANGEWNLTSKIPWYDEEGNVRGLIGATRFITEKKEYEERIKQKNKRLDRFVNIVSHDLRNPLSVASGYLSMVQEDVDHERLAEVEGALTDMEDLIEHLLELAQNGQDIDECEPVSLSGIFKDAWSSASTGDAEYTITDDQTFLADPQRASQLFGNLIRNSIDHVGEDVTIEIGTTEDGVYYQDDGPGIPDTIKDDIFDPGYTTSDDGTGFGLSIVQEIAGAHGWEVTLSDAETGGVRFDFQFTDPSCGYRQINPVEPADD